MDQAKGVMKSGLHTDYEGNSLIYHIVTVGDLPTALDTLGIYQPLNWAWLPGEHARVITTERSHIYHLNTTYLL